MICAKYEVSSKHEDQDSMAHGPDVVGKQVSSLGVITHVTELLYAYECRRPYGIVSACNTTASIVMFGILKRASLVAA